MKNLEQQLKVKVPAAQLGKTCISEIPGSSVNQTTGQNTTANTANQTTGQNKKFVFDAAIGGGIGAFLVLFICFIFFILFKRHRLSKEQVSQETSASDKNIVKGGPSEPMQKLGSSQLSDQKDAFKDDDDEYQDERTDPDLPSHVVLHREDNLKEKAKALAANRETLNKEFASLEMFVEETVMKGTMVAHRAENKPHNRYNDIGGGFVL